MNRNQPKGRLELFTGKVKKVVGKVFDDENMDMERKSRKNVGKERSRYVVLKEEIDNAS